MSLDAVVVAGPKDEDAKQLEAHRFLVAVEKKDASGLLTSLEKLIDLCMSEDDDEEEE